MERYLDYDISTALHLNPDGEVVRRSTRLKEMFRLLNELAGFDNHIAAYKGLKKYFDMVEVQAWLYHLPFEDLPLFKEKEVRKVIEQMSFYELPNMHRTQAIYHVTHIDHILMISFNGSIAVYKVDEEFLWPNHYRKSVPVFCKYDALGRDIFGRIRTQEQIITT